MTDQPVAIRVLITGSRTWDQVDVLHEALLDTWHDAIQIHGANAKLVVVHGACPKGADCQAAAWAAAQDTMAITTESHPADWDAHGRAAGFRRNADMIHLGADVCLAFIKSSSRGATHTADLAEKSGIPVRRFTA
ncbi:SLOG family protein [Streptomyces microflavus]|uniref:SLOG family protein n=1 Tax=Streptomyces microflavus TaxID=1919 RepID=UPI0033D4BFA1